MLNATLSARIALTNELLILRITPDAGVVDFVPGQYVALALPEDEDGVVAEPRARPKMIRRAYSIGSSPGEKGFLEFYVAVVPDGALTPRLAALKEGDRIFVTPKITGTFTLKDVPQDKDLVLVSTGTGIAPYMSMIRTESTWSAKRRIKVVHGVRYPSDLAYAEELFELLRSGKNIEYHQVVSRADDSWSGHRGHVQALFQNGTVSLDAEREHVFLCGNPAMIEGMEKLLVERGFVEHTKKTPGNLHLEKYW